MILIIQRIVNAIKEAEVKCICLWENRNENARGHEGVDNPSHPSCRTPLWFRSILREVPLVKRLWRTNEKIRADYLVGVRIPENTWPVQSRRKNAINPAFKIYFDVRYSRKCMILFSSFFFSFVFVNRFAHHRYLFGSCVPEVRLAFAKYLLQPIAKLMAHKSTLKSICGEWDWIVVGSFIFKSMPPRST